MDLGTIWIQSGWPRSAFKSKKAVNSFDVGKSVTYKVMKNPCKLLLQVKGYYKFVQRGKVCDKGFTLNPFYPFCLQASCIFHIVCTGFFFSVCSFRSKLAKVTLMFFGTPPEWFLYLLWNLVLFNFHFRRLDNEIFPQNRRDAAENAFGNRTSAALGMVKSLAEFSVANVAPSPSHFPPQLHRIFFYTFQQWSLKTRSFYLPI